MPKIVQRRKMGWIALTFHWTMMFMTVGLWTPVLLAARRGRNTTTYVPDGYPAPMPGQPYPPQPYGQQPPQQWAPPRQ
jgi:hypothetical protein